MKKISAIVLGLGIVYNVFGFAIPVEALMYCGYGNPDTVNCVNPTVGPGNTPASICVANVSYPLSNGCSCPTNTVLRTSYTQTGYGTFSCVQDQSQTLPACLQAQPGMSYIALAIQCRCPDNTTVWTNGGFTNQCPTTTPTSIPNCIQGDGNYWQGTLVQCKCPDGTTTMSNNGYTRTCANWTINCVPPLPGMTLGTLTGQCRCPDGTTVYGDQYHFTNRCTGWTPTVICWDGTQATNQNSCPAYKYCPNDSVTKRALSYQCVAPVCAADTVYTFAVTPQVVQCTCPTNTVMTEMGNPYLLGAHTFMCKTRVQTIPTCLQAQPGMYYTANAVQCRCPDNATVWSNGGYTNQCVWNNQPQCSYYQIWNGYQCVSSYPQNTQTCGTWQKWNGYYCEDLQQWDAYSQPSTTGSQNYRGWDSWNTNYFNW